MIKMIAKTTLFLLAALMSVVGVQKLIKYLYRRRNTR